MADSQVQIRIGAVVDPSLATSTAVAKDQINSIKTAQGQLAGSAASTNQQVTQSTQQETQKQTASWKAMYSEITRAESQLVSEIFSKRQSLAADLQKVGLRLVESEVTNALKTVTEHEMANIAILQSDKATAQEGLLYKLGAYLADQLGLTSSEAAKTGAVTAGETMRNTVKSVSDATGLAEQAASKSIVIASDADQAAAGAYASASQTPIVGWLLGPAAAATAGAAVMAYAAGGQLRVGAAEQPTMLHKDEMVWPGWAAHGARNMLASFSAGDFNVPRGGDTFTRSQSDATTHQWNYAPTIQGVPEHNVMDELRNNAAEFTSFIRGLSRGGAMRFG
jgi:hypothetical protein